MYLIVGLGNPGRQYDGTRHNIGFDVVDLLAKRHDIKIKATKFDAYAGEGFFYGQKLVLVKPTTFMNLSGRAVQDFVRYYKIPVEDLASRLVVIYDETNLPVGQVRIRERGTAGGHNGVKNI
ncbi:MAG: aminoacyl-tRNA hydrolase, partial [Defluviitaleaceae bacterium]|nr:aminoacyl-tRNA hydrolase [Defluviitaleaceae bacterium]